MKRELGGEKWVGRGGMGAERERAVEVGGGQ